MIGETVSHYEIIKPLGAGGMGVVYEAVDVRLRRSVAIKFLPRDCADNALARGRFEREAQTASSLDHPHICTIFDIGEHKGQPWLVMELLKGKTLRDYIGGRPLKIPDAIRIASEVADALEAAHSTGIIHRDIKTTNIFVDERGRARLLDFGLAKLVRDPQLDSGSALAVTQDYAEDVRTGTGTVLGTMTYMARAGPRRNGRRAGRPVLPGCRPLRNDDREAAVRRKDDRGHVRSDPQQAACRLLIVEPGCSR